MNKNYYMNTLIRVLGGKMKRKIILVFTIFVVLNLFLGCSNPSSIPTEDYRVEVDNTLYYKAECGTITNSTYRAAWNRASNWDKLSYSNIASLRNYLYHNTISDHAIETGVTINEIKEFMLSHGFSNYETECFIETLKEIGNNMAFFESAYGNDKIFWAYVTK